MLLQHPEIVDGELPEHSAGTRGRVILSNPNSSRPVLRNLDLGNDWLYGWGNLPTNLDDLRAWLKKQNIDVEDFKNSARYEANYDQFPWLKDL